MRLANSFRDLEVYNLSRELSKEVFELTKKLPSEERYSLTDQIRRSSRSVGAQIAEAWAKRRYEKHFISKLTDADGEQLETQHWIEVSLDCEYITNNLMNSLLDKCSSIGKMLNSMMGKSDQFCNKNG
ncbi:MAG: four helix bundle protein [Bacteroidales bacterium]